MSKIDLYNADCLEVMKNIPDNSIDLIVTDPPYLISATNGGGSVNKVKKLNKSLKDLVDANIDNGYDIQKFNTEFVRIMKNINIYIWCNKVQIPEYFNFYVNQHKCKFDILCWHKTNALPSYKNKYLSDTEYCLYFRKGGYCDPAQTEKEERYENAKTFYLAPLNQRDKLTYKHPTIKPLDFTKKIIKHSSKEGEVVLDIFMGSATIGVACKQLNRRFIGVELNKVYFEIARARIEGRI
jgi:site-specific DNA-methyltransferase (adenine-specific)